MIFFSYLSENEDEFNKYHEWRNRYKVLNEHGYSGTDNYHYCRICEALNYNSRTPTVYENIITRYNQSEKCVGVTYKLNR